MEIHNISLKCKKIFFTVKAIKHWSRLHRETVDSPSLKILKIQLDMFLGKLVLADLA